MRFLSSLLKYSFIYAKNYILESLAIRFPQIRLFTPKPLYVGLSVGTVCNLKCRQCDLWKMKTNPDKYLKPRQVKRILLSLKKWLGPFRLVFTGAEPFIRKDILKIIGVCRENDIYTVLTSNGWLINQNKAREIVKSGLDVINISLDGVDSKTHDFLRGRKGAFEKATQALKFLKKYKNKKERPIIYINTVIMEPNIGQLEKLVKLTKKFGIDNIRFQALESKFLFGNKKYDPQWYKKEPLWPKDWEKLSTVLDKIKLLKEKGYPVKNTYQELEDIRLYYKNPLLLVNQQHYCFTGVRNFSIDSQGKVRLCFGMKPVGDLLKKEPEEIWYGKKAVALRQIIANCQRACRILPCNKRESLNQLIPAFWQRIKSIFK